MKIYKGDRTTHATSNLGIWLNGKIGFVFGMIWQIRRMGLI